MPSPCMDLPESAPWIVRARPKFFRVSRIGYQEGAQGAAASQSSCHPQVAPAQRHRMSPAVAGLLAVDAEAVHACVVRVAMIALNLELHHAK